MGENWKSVADPTGSTEGRITCGDANHAVFSLPTKRDDRDTNGALD